MTWRIGAPRADIGRIIRRNLRDASMSVAVRLQTGCGDATSGPEGRLMPQSGHTRVTALKASKKPIKLLMLAWVSARSCPSP